MNDQGDSKGLVKDEPKTANRDEEDADCCYRSGASFESLGLSERLCLNLRCELKFVSPSRIQAESLPITLSADKPNFIGQAKFGSGKTVAYGLVMMSRVDAKLQQPQALCLVPTRELANQVHEVLDKLARQTGITIKKSIPDEPRGMIKDQIVVGTPGTLLGQIKHHDLNTSRIMVFVCDEADKMCSLQGFADQTLSIKDKCTCKPLQVLLFSGTFPKHVEHFANRVAPNAQSIRLKQEQISLHNVRQFWIEAADDDDKYQKLTTMYALMDQNQSVVFVDTVKRAKEMTNRLRAGGFAVSVIYGKDMNAKERDAVMRDFISGKTTVLISTDLLARGIDVTSVNIVVNYQLPVARSGSQPDFETYAHRVGRTGRFGRAGIAINFITPQQKHLIQQLETFFNHPIIHLPFKNENLEQLETTLNQHLKPHHKPASASH